ncbi:hypothetical protein CCACVL1_01956, partial [Corchorus capsularis]
PLVPDPWAVVNPIPLYIGEFSKT